jgi:PRTRC genetic system ThiF family protein
MTYTVHLDDRAGRPVIVVVGCGGTGSFVAEDLCRLMVKSPMELLLVDYDEVEERNLIRQNFYPEDLGQSKSKVLAERLASRYGREVGYSIFPFSADLTNRAVKSGRWLFRSIHRKIVIGCVDRARSRREIAKSLDYHDWWIDAGNGYESGQVLLGNATTVGKMENAFSELYHEVTALPIPSLQVPALLVEATREEPVQLDCAEAVEQNLQSPVINRAMAMLVVDLFQKLLNGNLTWMGAYIDLEAGSLTPVPADPTTVARMLGMKVNRLMSREGECHNAIPMTPRPPMGLGGDNQ